MKRRFTFQTPLIPSIPLPPTPENRQGAAKLWLKVYYNALLPAELFSRNWLPQENGLYNPEYLLVDWCGRILDANRLKDDVLGWALHALTREQGFYLGQLSPEHRAKLLGWKPDHTSFLKGREPILPEILKESQAQEFLVRYKGWMDARLAYHRLALRLTFFKSDPLASAPPIRDDLTRLSTRFTDWRDVRIRQQQELFEEYRRKHREQIPPRGSEIYGVEFICWMKDHGVKSGAISWNAINWLCWLQLVSPISKDWEPHESARAVRKMFLDEKFRHDAAKWWANPPIMTYEPQDDSDDFATAAGKAIVSHQFSEFVEDYLSNELADLKTFTNTLTKQLNEYGIPHKQKRGKPKRCVEEIPDIWQRGDRGALLKALQAIAAGRTSRGSFDPEAAYSDLEKDEPKGWLAARHVTF